jgi:hypothetical protein
VLVGALSHSSRARGVFASEMTFAVALARCVLVAEEEHLAVGSRSAEPAGGQLPHDLACRIRYGRRFCALIRYERNA